MTNTTDVVSTDDAPPAVGAYSQGRTAGGVCYTAGQLGMTPDGELLADADVATQTDRALRNVRAVVRAAGGDVESILEVTVYLRDADDFDAMNEAYAAHFEGAPPARSAVEAAPPVEGADVEIAAVAHVG